jgi:hypothetical protein
MGGSIMKTILSSDLLGYKLLIEATKLLGNTAAAERLFKSSGSVFSLLLGVNFDRQRYFLDMYQISQWQHFVERADEYSGMAGLLRADSMLSRVWRRLSGTNIITTATMRSRPRWRISGWDTTLVGPDQKKYAAIKFESDSYYQYKEEERSFQVYEIKNQPYPLICINTSHNRRIWMMQYDGVIVGKEDVSKIISLIKETERYSKGQPLRLVVPQVVAELDNHDFDFLKGLGVYDQRIEQVFTQIKIIFAPTRFNEPIPDQKLVYQEVVVRGPFLFWITTDSDDTGPILAEGYITSANWRKPPFTL